jgi:NADP-dependent 3-hydroxy acid dehydrogenase YdfG
MQTLIVKRDTTGVSAFASHLEQRTMTLKDKTLFVSGGSRGIGLEIAQRPARDGPTSR